MCDHDYYCANSLFCELNGGDCKHTVQAKHSRNKTVVHDVEKDERFERVPNYDDIFKDWQDSYAYVEKEITNEDTKISG